MLQKYYSIFVVFAGSCLLSIVNSAPVNCKAFDAARWRMINLKLCQTAQSLTHRRGRRGAVEGSERGRAWGSSKATFLAYIKTATVWCQRHELQLISDKVHKNNQPNGRGSDPVSPCLFALDPALAPLDNSNSSGAFSSSSSYNLHQMFKCCCCCCCWRLALFVLLF